MKIPFALPLIDEDVISEVNDCLVNTGWLTSGPKVRELEDILYSMHDRYALCVNSWTSGAMLMLRWFDIGPGDEVIVPAYTYSATALCAMNIGANIVMVDVGEDFSILPEKINEKITSRTKAIIPVDIGGWPCDYDKINRIVENQSHKFKPKGERQEKLGRPLIITDAAHSIGATYKGELTGTLADVSVFSFHSVKNITTGEGGAIVLNLPQPFSNKEEYDFLKYFSLNGQTKSAFQKNQVGGWRYDIVAQGLKVNMPDICAAIGLAQIRKYKEQLLPERRAIFKKYNDAFHADDWAELPPFKNENRFSSAHLYPLRFKGLTEEKRDQLINKLSSLGIGVNVHYIPMPMLSLFKKQGFDIKDFPSTYDNYSREISLPIYNGLTNAQLDYVIDGVKKNILGLL